MIMRYDQRSDSLLQLILSEVGSVIVPFIPHGGSTLYCQLHDVIVGSHTVADAHCPDTGRPYEH